MDEVRAEDLVQKIGQPRKDRAVLVAGVDNLTPLGKVTPVTVDDDGNLHVRADKLEEKLEELLGERQQNPAAWSIADRLRRLEEKLALLESGQAKVTLSGSIPPIIRTLVSSPLTAGQSLTFGPFSLDNRPSGFLSYIADADTPIRIAVECVVGSFWTEVVSVVLDTGSPSVRIIPPFHPMSRQYRVRVENPTAINQTRCSVVELYHTLYNPHPQNMRAVLVKNLAIRDTSTHSPGTDPQYIFRLSRVALGGSKLTIAIDNRLNQSLTVNIRLVVGLEMTIGTTTVPAASRQLITGMDFPDLDGPSETVNLLLSCSTAPTSGVVNAYVNTLVGGGA